MFNINIYYYIYNKKINNALVLLLKSLLIYILYIYILYFSLIILKKILVINIYSAYNKIFYIFRLF